MQVPEHRRTVAKKRNGTVHTFRQKNIAPAGEPTVRPHAAKPDAHCKAGRPLQSRTPTAKPDAHCRAGRTPQSRTHTAKPDADGKTKAERPYGRSAYPQAVQAPI